MCTPAFGLSWCEIRVWLGYLIGHDQYNKWQSPRHHGFYGLAICCDWSPAFLRKYNNQNHNLFILATPYKAPAQFQLAAPFWYHCQFQCTPSSSQTCNRPSASSSSRTLERAQEEGRPPTVPLSFSSQFSLPCYICSR